MVKSNRYTPTNKYFRNKFQDFASTKTKKGHLNNTGNEEDEGAKKLTGTLVKIDRKKLYDNGWLVETTEKKQYWCSYGDGVLCIPDSTVSDTYYVPKAKTEVEISIDEKNSIYTITRLKDPNKKPIALFDDKIEISTNTNTQTNKNNTAKIEVGKDKVNITGNTIVDSFKANAISVEGVVGDDVIVKNTVSNNVTTNNLITEQILTPDEDEPTMQMYSSTVMFNKGVMMPHAMAEEFHGGSIHANKIHLNDEDLGGRLDRLEQRIKELEDGN